MNKKKNAQPTNSMGHTANDYKGDAQCVCVCYVRTFTDYINSLKTSKTFFFCQRFCRFKRKRLHYVTLSASLNLDTSITHLYVAESKNRKSDEKLYHLYFIFISELRS